MHSLILLLISFVLTAHGLRADDVKVSSRWGFNPVDSTEAIQSALDSGARTIVIDRQESDWIVRPLFITNSNVEVVLEDGVTIRAKRGKFHGKTDCLFKIDGNVENITLRGKGNAALVMNKSDYLDVRQYSVSEWRHAVSILHAKNVVIRNLKLRSSGGDGVYVNGAEQVLLEDLVCTDHNRQGSSPISVKGMTVRRCTFNDTYGAPPQSGIDLEPNRAYNCFVDVSYEDCEFNGNAYHGIEFHLGQFTSKTEPMSVSFRRCVAKNNHSSGISILCGDAEKIPTYGVVSGRILFEDCLISGNGREPLKIMNQVTNGLQIAFARCQFDAVGSSAESAILFANTVATDFGGVTFDDCSVKITKGMKPCLFESPDGIGIANFSGNHLAVDCEGVQTNFDLSAFASAHAPQPEKVVKFKSAAIDFRGLDLDPNNYGKAMTFMPFVRKAFTYVYVAPTAGVYNVIFRSRKINPSKGGDSPLCAVCQLWDKAGTDLGKFDIPSGEFSYTINASGPNVYRFEIVQRNSGIVSVASKISGGAILANRQIALFHGNDVRFKFRVPANAKEVLVSFLPDEPASAQLINSKGEVVCDVPFRKAAQILKASCSNVSDEVWTLRFPKIEEDMKFQLGGSTIPLIY